MTHLTVILVIWVDMITQFMTVWERCSDCSIVTTIPIHYSDFTVFFVVLWQLLPHAKLKFFIVYISTRFLATIDNLNYLNPSTIKTFNKCLNDHYTKLIFLYSITKILLPQQCWRWAHWRPACTWPCLAQVRSGGQMAPHSSSCRRTPGF